MSLTCSHMGNKREMRLFADAWILWALAGCWWASGSVRPATSVKWEMSSHQRADAAVSAGGMQVSVLDRVLGPAEVVWCVGAASEETQAAWVGCWWIVAGWWRVLRKLTNMPAVGVRLGSVVQVKWVWRLEDEGGVVGVSRESWRTAHDQILDLCFADRWPDEEGGVCSAVCVRKWVVLDEWFFLVLGRSVNDEVLWAEIQ